MATSAALAHIPVQLLSTAARPASPAGRSKSGMTAERVNHLSSLLLQRENKSSPRSPASSKLTFTFGQWGN